MMLKSAPLDLLYICAELVTGKSIPVLVGLVRLPIGQGLAWLSVTIGAIAGACFSVWAARHTQSLTVLSFINRLLQLCFSLFLSISHLLALAKGIHPEHGVTLALIPAFCVVWQPLPQRHSTALVSFLLSWATFYVCGIMTSIDAGVVTSAHSLDEAMKHQKLAHHTASPTTVVTLQQIVLRALQLFALGAYAAIQHAPTEVYFDARHIWASCRHRRPTYASHHHTKHAFYTLFMSLVATWLRVCAWTVVCFSQENFLTLMLETTRIEPARFDRLCFVFYAVTLLYSATWTATQLREQILPCFLHPDDASNTLRIFVFVFAFAAYYRQRAPEAMFAITHALTAVSVVTALATLKERVDQKKGGETQRSKHGHQPSHHHSDSVIVTKAHPNGAR